MMFTDDKACPASHSLKGTKPGFLSLLLKHNPVKLLPIARTMYKVPRRCRGRKSIREGFLEEVDFEPSLVEKIRFGQKTPWCSESSHIMSKY